MAGYLVVFKRLYLDTTAVQSSCHELNLELKISVADLCLFWQREASYDQCKVSIVVCIEHRICLQPHKIKDFFC